MGIVPHVRVVSPRCVAVRFCFPLFESPSRKLTTRYRLQQQLMLCTSKLAAGPARTAPIGKYSSRIPLLVAYLCTGKCAELQPFTKPTPRTVSTRNCAAAGVGQSRVLLTANSILSARHQASGHSGIFLGKTKQKRRRTAGRSVGAGHFFVKLWRVSFWEVLPILP